MNTNNDFELSENEAYDRLVKMGLIRRLDDWTQDLIEDCFADVPSHVLDKLTELDSVAHNSIIANHPNTSVETLDKLARFGVDNGGVRSRVASNPNTSIESLIILSKDWILDVREQVALNPNTPTEVLTKLANDRSIYVRMAVKRNRNTSPEVKDMINNINKGFISRTVEPNETPENI
jgi:hypothetical protein